MSQIAIEVNELTKVYHLYRKPLDRLLEVLDPRNRVKHSDFYALDHVSFQVKAGEAVGIIGTNGAGKSTLLKILNEVLEPTSGLVTVRGRTAALLELGAGFNPEYTGLENLYLNGLLMGRSREETDRKLEEILDFAEIGDFIYQPVKTYSSGMFARLAFAASIHVDPDILIVDEALSVGDIRFQQKCFRRMNEMKKEKTILFVTHDMGAVTKFCDHALWLEQGRIRSEGVPREVVRDYQAFLAEKRVRETTHVQDAADPKAGRIAEIPIGEIAFRQLEPIDRSLESYGTKEAVITEQGLFLKGSEDAVHMISGQEEVIYVMRVHKERSIAHPIAGLTLTDRLGTVLAGMNSFMTGDDIRTEDEESLYVCHFVFPPLNEGIYTISPAFAEGTQSDHVMLHWVYDAWEVQVVTPFEQNLNGVLALRDYHFSVLPNHV